ncbi:MAG: hypothetical protein HZB26_09120 [Candidatus Hydrogenedentes bacterium]|nr:hypothetical protein [Candidatus Hydrogenedentota bacterium]
MKSKGWFGAAAIAVVVVGVACLFLGQELTGSKREAAVTRIHELADTYNVAPAATKSSSVRQQEATVPKTGNNDDARVLFLRIAAMEKALRESNPRGYRACNGMEQRGHDATPEDLPNLELYLVQADEVIRETRRLASMTGPYFDLEYPTAPYMHYPALQTLYSVSELLCADAWVESRKNSPFAPVEDLVAVMRLAYGIPREPDAHTGQYHYILYRFVLQAAEGVITASSVTTDQLNSLEAQVPRDAERESFRRALIGHASVTLEFFDNARKKRSAMADLPEWLYFGPFGTPWSNQDETYYAETMAGLADMAVLPYYEAKPRLDALERAYPRPSRWLPFERVRSPLDDPTRFLGIQADHEARLDILRMGLFLQVYHQQHGAYPESLQGIVENLGGHVPVDPYSSKDYVFRPSGDSFLLYSVGENGIDNGGVDSRNRKEVTAGDDVAWHGKA